MPRTLSVNDKLINFYLGNSISLCLLTIYTAIKLRPNADWEYHLTYDILALDIVFGINMLYFLQVGIRCAVQKERHGNNENIRIILTKLVREKTITTKKTTKK